MDFATPLPPPSPRALDRAAELIRASSRPMVVAGAQCAPKDSGWLLAFAEVLPAPVLTTRNAQGSFPHAHPLAFGIFTGSAGDEPVLGRADLIVAFGLEPEELGPRQWPYSALVVHLCRKPSSGYPFTPLVDVVGELGLILEELAPRLRGPTQVDWNMFELDRLRKSHRGRLAPVASPPKG